MQPQVDGSRGNRGDSHGNTRARVSIAVFVATVLMLSACTSTTGLLDDAAAPADSEPAQPEPAPSEPAQPDDQPTGDRTPADEEPTDRAADPAPTPKPEPVPYVPVGQPGDASAYGEMIDRLAEEVPSELRDQVPWPDLRNPDPVAAQTEIFDLWIWMAANFPEPRLVEIMAAPGSPSREEIVSIFGRKAASGHLEERNGQPYRAFDHVTVTFESAGLPLWLGRDVPVDAVVIYYTDNAGPTDVLDRETRELLFQEPGVGDRAWLSIMVPTDVGWQLWRDELIEPNDSELPIPDFPPPGVGTERPLPEV